MKRRTTYIFALAVPTLLLAYMLARAGAPGPATTTSSTMDPQKTAPSSQPAAGPSCTIGPNPTCGEAHWQGHSDDEWKKLLTPEQYHIAREAGTERAFTGKYWNTHTKGVYHCAVCNLPLFSSQTKFDSGTGWPSFYQPVAKDAVTVHRDESHGMVREEVRCGRCGSHLGHVFNDGPPPTHLRYCMNSAVLNLVPDAPEAGKEKGK